MIGVLSQYPVIFRQSETALPFQTENLSNYNEKYHFLLKKASHVK